MSGPILRVDLDIIEKNARSIAAFCADHGISVTGVTKVTCGMPAVARALLRGGVSSLGESRLENIHRMRADGVTAPCWLLRVPPLSEVEEIVTSVDISLNSEISVIRALSAAAERRDLVHDIVLMVDLGDLREGLWPDDLLPTVREIVDLAGVRLRGLGTNLTCYGGVLPTEENMRSLVNHKHRVEEVLGRSLDILSGGNSSSLDLLRRGGMPKEVNNLRLGESLMLGRETAYRRIWPGARPDAFVLEAELIELKEKPSVPIGERGVDAFGERPKFKDRGQRLRGILNVGREDVKVEGLFPLDEALTILGASSDHLLLDVTARLNVSVGGGVSFLLDYGALLAAMTSRYVRKEPHYSGVLPKEERPLLLLVGRHLKTSLPGSSDTLGEALKRDLSSLGYAGLLQCDSPEDASDALRRGALPIVTGGDGDLETLLETAGKTAGPLGLLWLSPRLEGSTLLDFFLRPESRAGLVASLAPENTVVVGLREAGPVVRNLFGDRRVGVYTMEDIDLLGLRQVIRQSLARAASGVRGVILRYDAAVTDGGSEGITRRETYLVMELTARSGLLRGLDLSGSLPPRSRAEAESLLRYCGTVLGRKILGR